jgi:hypothetical protein
MRKTMTIGDRFSDLGNSLEDVVWEISDAEFEVKFLGTFAYRLELRESCLQAVAELAGEPFAGRVSCAKLMGRAMELLRDVYHANAPRGWYPVMKILREVSAPAPSPATPDDDIPETNNDFGEPVSPRKWFDGYLPPPHPRSVNPDNWYMEEPYRAADLFTAPCSPIRGYDDYGVLQGEAERSPALMRAFISVAEARGVPCGWGKNSFDYAEAVIAELQRQNEPVTEALVRFREEMREREIEYAAAKKKPPAQQAHSRHKRG